MKNSLKYFSVFMILCITLWWSLFFSFLKQIPRAKNSFSEKQEAIVVLTGGSKRLEEGLHLLQQKKGTKLLISGAGKGVVMENILTMLLPEHDAFKYSICLGYKAHDTITNGLETAAWMKKEEFNSLYVVTSYYHLPRTLLIFHYLMPHITMVPYPVFSSNLQMEKWWLNISTLRIFLKEFHKYLLMKIVINTPFTQNYFFKGQQ